MFRVLIVVMLSTIQANSVTPVFGGSNQNLESTITFTSVNYTQNTGFISAVEICQSNIGEHISGIRF